MKRLILMLAIIMFVACSSNITGPDKKRDFQRRKLTTTESDTCQSMNINVPTVAHAKK